jgi:vitamin B12 transporter
MKTKTKNAGWMLAIAATSFSLTQTLTLPVQAADDLTNPDIVVTGSRIVQTIDDSLPPVTIITREAIEIKQPRDVQDLVRQIPGVSLVNSGGLGKSTSISLRGSESNHVLVLVDGVRVGSATTGSVALQHIPVQQIERIEVVRGPRSHLYGSSAIGGVIQIFTKKGSKKLQHSGSIGYGSHETMEADTGISGSVDNTSFAANVGMRRSEGINACGDGQIKASGGCFALEPDKDGYKQQFFSGTISREFENGLDLEFQAQAANDATEFDGNSQNQGKGKQRLLGVNVDKEMNDTWGLKVSTSRSWDLTHNYKNSVFASTFNTVRDNASIQNDLQITDTDLVVLGVDYLNDKIKSTTSYAETSRFNYGAFGQYIGEFGDHTAQLSLRGDENEQFGNNFTGSAAWGYALRPDLELLASYGTAYNAPTFNELYFPSFGSESNQPEKSKSYEIGVRGTESLGTWAVYAFQTDVEDLIAFDSDTSLAANIDAAKIRGIEAETSLTWAAWEIDSSASYIDARNKSSGSNHDNRLTRRPKWNGTVNVSRKIDDFRVGASAHYAGVAYDNASNARKLAPYKTVDLRGSYDVRKNWRMELSANNIFGETYQTASFFNQDERNYFLRMRYVPDAD